MKKSLVVSLVLVCSIALVFSGCRRKTAAPRLNLDNAAEGSQPALVDETSGGGIGTADALSPRSDAFTSGTRVDAKFDTVLFDFDSAQVADVERAKVEAAAKYLKDNGNTVAILEGHCDERGSNEYNMSLGERRALAVRAYLVSLGIDAARIQTRSFGEERPVNQGHDEESWTLNRRVEFVVMR